MTQDQIGQVFTDIVGMPPRDADIAVVRMLGGTPDVLAEYIWDHWMGEPDEPSLGDVTSVVNQIIAERWPS